MVGRARSAGDLAGCPVRHGTTDNSWGIHGITFIRFDITVAAGCHAWRRRSSSQCSALGKDGGDGSAVSYFGEDSGFTYSALGSDGGDGSAVSYFGEDSGFKHSALGSDGGDGYGVSCVGEDPGF